MCEVRWFSCQGVECVREGCRTVDPEGRGEMERKGMNVPALTERRGTEERGKKSTDLQTMKRKFKFFAPNARGKTHES